MDDISAFLRRKLNSPVELPEPQIAKLPMGNLEYAISGSGKPILIIHGAAGGYDQAILLFRRYIPAGYQIICPSRPGYLGTPLETGASAEQQADACAALLDYLNIPSAIIIGISAGGLALYPFAIRHPQKTRGIIAVAAIAGEYLLPEQAGKLAQAFFLTDFGSWLTKETLIYFPENIIKNLIRAEGYLDPIQIEKRVKEIMNVPEYLEVIADLMCSMANYKTREIGTLNDITVGAKTSWYDFSQINCPALIIHGTHDADVKFHNGVFAYEGIAAQQKERVWLEYGTHFAFFFARQAPQAQQKFRDFIVKHS